MSDNVVDFKKRQEQARHEQKEAGFEKIKERFESVVPVKKSKQDKLLNLFKKKKNTRPQKKR